MQYKPNSGYDLTQSHPITNHGQSCDYTYNCTDGTFNINFGKKQVVRYRW